MLSDPLSFAPNYPAARTTKVASTVAASTTTSPGSITASAGTD
jgi:hypothetical protein